MSNDFVPLVPPSAQAPDASAFRLKVVPRGQTSQPFTPVIVATVGHPAVSAEAQPASAATEAKAEPTITLQRERERITRIQIKCSCGQMIELSCVYYSPQP